MTAFKMCDELVSNDKEALFKKIMISTLSEKKLQPLLGVHAQVVGRSGSHVCIGIILLTFVLV